MDRLSSGQIRKLVASLPTFLVQQLTRVNCPKVIIAGGFLRDVLCGIQPRDIDLFGEDFPLPTLVTNDMYIRQPSVLETYISPYSVDWVKVNVQDRSYYNFAEFVISEWDFTINQIALWYENGNWEGWTVSNGYDRLITSKRLLMNGYIREPVKFKTIFWRAIHLISKGYTINEPDLREYLHRFLIESKIGVVIDPVELTRILQNSSNLAAVGRFGNPSDVVSWGSGNYGTAANPIEPVGANISVEQPPVNLRQETARYTPPALTFTNTPSRETYIASAPPQARYSRDSLGSIRSSQQHIFGNTLNLNETIHNPAPTLTES